MRIVVWTMVVLWFLHLIVGAGAAFCIVRLWFQRENLFVRATMIHLIASPLHALMAIVLLFLAKGVQLTWKFSITWFAFSVLMNIARVPLIWYILRGPKEKEGPHDAERPSASGELPPEHWQARFDAIEASISQLRRDLKV